MTDHRQRILAVIRDWFVEYGYPQNTRLGERVVCSAEADGTRAEFSARLR
ncbi:hypothetical protein [Nocardia sp. bgisy134]